MRSTEVTYYGCAQVTALQGCNRTQFQCVEVYALFDKCCTPVSMSQAACTLALSPMRDTLIEGFSHFVSSMTAPVASGWSVRRVGFAPTGKRRLATAHGQSGHAWCIVSSMQLTCSVLSCSPALGRDPTERLMPFVARMRRMALTPGPPVMLDISTSRIAATWLSARPGRRQFLICELNLAVYVGPPAASPRRIRSVADPCAGVRLDHQSNDSHRRSGTRRRQRNDAGRADRADRRRPHNGYWPVQSSAGVGRHDVRSWRFDQHHTVRPRGREPWLRGGISGIAAVGLAAVLLLWLLMPETNPSIRNDSDYRSISPKDLRIRWSRTVPSGGRRSPPMGDALGVGEDGQRGWDLGHRHDASPLQGQAALSIVIGQKTQIGKDLQVIDFIQTSVSHRT